MPCSPRRLTHHTVLLSFTVTPVPFQTRLFNKPKLDHYSNFFVFSLHRFSPVMVMEVSNELISIPEHLWKSYPSSCSGMSILRQGWTNGNCEERTLYDISEHRSNLPFIHLAFVQDWPKAAFPGRNYPKLRSFDRLSADAMTMERRISKHAINNIA